MYKVKALEAFLFSARTSETDLNWALLTERVFMLKNRQGGDY